MSKTLEQIRIETIASYPPHEHAYVQAGFDAAIAHLSESAGEFDEAAFIDQFSYLLPGPRGLVRDGARWQFEQDRARVTLWQYEAKREGINADALREQVKELTARTEKAERERDEYKAQIATLSKEVTRLKDIEETWTEVRKWKPWLHFCYSAWDGLVIDVNDQEFEACTCFDERKKPKSPNLMNIVQIEQLQEKLAAAEARADNNFAVAEKEKARVRELERLRDEDAEIYERMLKERK